MQLTKVNRVRIAVGKDKNNGNGGRGILYPAPNETGRVMNIEEQIQRRVEHANRQYSVFHMSDLPRDMEGHFIQLVKMAKYAKSEEEFSQKLTAYGGYNDFRANGDKRFIKIEACNVQASGGALKMELERHVRERMTDTWQENKNSAAAIAILQCICDGQNFKAAVEALMSRNDMIADFYEACEECDKQDGSRPYVFSSNRLENNFSLLMKGLVARLDSSDLQAYQQEDSNGRENALRKQLAWLKDVKQLEYKRREKATGKEITEVIDLSKFSYAFAQTERLQAITVRMRKSLKWGENKRIAMLLMQGLSRVDDKDLSLVVGELEQKEPENLLGFIDAVNRDYYRFNIAKSVKNIDVKVQVFEDENHPGKTQLRLSGVENKKRAALSRTLERYATSEEEAKAVLRSIKSIIFEYFLPREATEEYLEDENLWKFPVGNDLYFDEGFEEKEDDSARRITLTLGEFWEKNYRDQSGAMQLKKRIGYVNYGKYCSMAAPLRQEPAGEDVDFKIYWITHIKEYVEKEYVDKKGALHREECYRTAMARRCWKNMIQFICGKYIDLGKAVFHFAMPEDMAVLEDGEKAYGVIREEYADGITSFSYEAIKAEEVLQRNIAAASVSAVSNFYKSVMDIEKIQKSKKTNLEDILFMSEADIKYFSKATAKKLVLRYYGGSSTIEKQAEMDTFELLKELRQHLKEIRNENFHYGTGKQGDVPCKYTSMLWNNDIKAYSEVSRKKYYTNSVAMFYRIEDIKQFVEKLYADKVTAPAHVPGFQNVWKRKDLSEYMDTLSFSWEKGDKRQVIYEGALYFLLKELYYQAFIVDERAARYFLDAVEDYVNHDATGTSLRPAINFKTYIETIKKNTAGELTFAAICQMINREYNQQNTNKDTGETYAHFKVLLPLCIKKGFQQYIKDHYSFLNHPIYNEEITPRYLDEVAIGGLMEECSETMETTSERKYLWYTFAHFISPTDLNFLIGDFKSYIQYREDVLKRTGYAGLLCSDKEREQEEAVVRQGVDRAKEILEVLEFVRGVCGRVSKEFSDYYGTEEQNDRDAREQYARYLEQYIDFGDMSGETAYERLQKYCYYTLQDGSTIDIYTDNNNPKLLKNVEISRMYAEDIFALNGYQKVAVEDIREYYRNKDTVAQILSNGLCKDAEEKAAVIRLQNLKNRITLNEITEIYSIINEMLGYLVSAAYLRERDEMYLLLGFYYMALLAGDQWNEGLNTLEGKISEGFVLYQIVSLFDFGLPLLRKKNEGYSETGGQVSVKIKAFYRHRKASMNYALALFESDSRRTSNLRNYVDHFKYYVDHKKSILDLYSEYYSLFFEYSSKLTGTIYNTFLNILLRRQVIAKLETMKERKFIRFKLSGDLTPKPVTYKLQNDKKAELPGLSESFLKSLQQMLEYKETK